jgi:glycosyltransferase involved in cell wall biosynthesis
MKLAYSVVVCNYNKLYYLQKIAPAIRELLKDRDGEMILVDDNSNDGSLEWAKESGLFDKIWQAEKDEEYCLNTIRNKGFDLAEKDHVVLLDADCLPVKSYFDGHDSIFDQDKEDDNYSKCKFCISVGFTDFFDKEGVHILNSDHRKQWLGGKDWCSMGWLAAYGGNICIERQLWKDIGGFSEEYNGSWGLEDADFSYRAEKVGARIKAHKLAAVKHLLHPLSGTKEDRSGRGKNREIFKRIHGFYPV